MTRAVSAALAAALLALVSLLAWGAAGDPIAVPKLTARVIDQTGTLTPAERDALEAKLRAFEQSRGTQIAVLLVPTLEGEPIEDFSTRVTDAWQLGRKGVDDGVLFVIAKQDRKMRIQTGRGVQGGLTDALSKRIIAEIVAPHFRDGDFFGGIDAALGAIIKAVEGEELPLPEPKAQSRGASSGSFPDFIFVAFFLVPVIGMVLRGLVGRFFGAGLTGGLTGLAAGLVFGSLVFGLFAAIAAFVFTLFVGSGVARGIRPGGWGGGGWGGGGFGGGGFSGGGGGDGGFSGGGGSFDGGGASGNW